MHINVKLHLTTLVLSLEIQATNNVLVLSRIKGVFHLSATEFSISW